VRFRVRAHDLPTRQRSILPQIGPYRSILGQRRLTVGAFWDIFLVTGMSNASPSPETRFRPGFSGNLNGRPSVKFIRDILRERDEAGKPWREQIVRHLIEVATRWNVIVLGREMEVASARDSVEAAKLLFGYDVGKPAASTEEQYLNLAEHFRQISRDQFEVLVKMLGDRLKTMEPTELARFLRECDRDPRRYIQAAEAELAARAEGLPAPAGELAEQPQEPQPQEQLEPVADARVELPDEADGE